MKNISSVRGDAWALKIVQPRHFLLKLQCHVRKASGHLCVLAKGIEFVFLLLQFNIDPRCDEFENIGELKY